ncbi:hypothetical protein [Prosthecobacter sp.]|uniref:hypothetical protein n=1 Tax=Prosthecobacter sp. TaxID=1965333 RepID=UPI0024895A77|nr:hypothetical protein [Prosthecobacter sp.]MDI1310889.1 hypothetical protein [Prosthecobacter sp.]
MFKPRHNDLHSFLQWRRQTRFIRHHGGPIIAVSLFVIGLLFAWRACDPAPPPEHVPTVEEHQRHEIDRTLHATKMPKW